MSEDFKLPGVSNEATPSTPLLRQASVSSKGRTYSQISQTSESELAPSKVHDVAKATEKMKNELLKTKLELTDQADKLERVINKRSMFEQVFTRIFGDSASKKLNETNQKIKDIGQQIQRFGGKKPSEVPIVFTGKEINHARNEVDELHAKAVEKNYGSYQKINFKNNVYKAAQELILKGDKSPDINVKRENYRQAFALLEALKEHADFKPNSMDFLDKLENGIKERMGELPTETS